VSLRWPGMRWTKAALLVFGLGLVLGFVAVVGEVARLERPASVLMALGVMMLPAGLFADGRGVLLLRWIAARLTRQPRPKPRRQNRAAVQRRAAGPLPRAGAPASGQRASRPPRKRAGRPRSRRG